MKKLSLISLSLLSLAFAAPVTYGMEGKKPRLPKSIEWLACLSGVGFAGWYTYKIYDLGYKAGEKTAYDIANKGLDKLEKRLHPEKKAIESQMRKV